LALRTHLVRACFDLRGLSSRESSSKDVKYLDSQHSMPAAGMKEQGYHFIIKSRGLGLLQSFVLSLTRSAKGGASAPVPSGTPPVCPGNFLETWTHRRLGNRLRKPGRLSFKAVYGSLARLVASRSQSDRLRNSAICWDNLRQPKLLSFQHPTPGAEPPYGSEFRPGLSYV